jgi:hypothetical protein
LQKEFQKSKPKKKYIFSNMKMFIGVENDEGFARRVGEGKANKNFYF